MVCSKSEYPLVMYAHGARTFASRGRRTHVPLQDAGVSLRNSGDRGEISPLANGVAVLNEVKPLSGCGRSFPLTLHPGSKQAKTKDEGVVASLFPGLGRLAPFLTLSQALEERRKPAR